MQKAAIKKRVSKARRVLPETPKSFGKAIDILARSASPSNSVAARGLKRNLDDTFFSGLQTEVGKVSSKKKEDRKKVDVLANLCNSAKLNYSQVKKIGINKSTYS